MTTVKITAIKQTVYTDLIAQYENPLEQPCELQVGQVFLSQNGKMPHGFCQNAWETIAPFVNTLAKGGGNFYNGWMKNPQSAMISCNDGFRPMSFHLETIEDNLQ